MLSEISQTEKDKYHMISMWNLKNKTKQNENRLIDAENRRLPEERRVGGQNR